MVSLILFPKCYKSLNFIEPINIITFTKLTYSPIWNGNTIYLIISEGDNHCSPYQFAAPIA